LQRRDRLEQIINLVLGIQVGSYVENHGIDLYCLAKEKVVANILERRYWARTETVRCAISVTLVPGLAKRD
jgi:hypothetical protein